MATEAIYFDGETARDNRVAVKLEAPWLTFSGDGVPLQSWSLSGLAATEAPQEGQYLRLCHDGHTGARLSIRNDEFVQQLLIAAPQLKGGFNARRSTHLFIWIAGGLTILALLIYLTLNFAPQRIAVLLPETWRVRVGEQMEASLVGGAKACQSPAGDKAIGTMLGYLAEGNPEMPPLRVRVYDIPIVNAFALPGGFIVMTRGLIDKATTPDEVAGVLAHEIGHVAHRHPEAQLVRVAGVQILLSLATGTSGGTNTSSIAGLAAILKSSRDAEREADAYAVAMLSAARIDPAGLRRFFEKVMAEEGKNSNGALSKLGTVFSTHPVTMERIEMITPLQADAQRRPALPERQWEELKGICG